MSCKSQRLRRCANLRDPGLAQKELMLNHGGRDQGPRCVDALEMNELLPKGGGGLRVRVACALLLVRDKCHDARQGRIHEYVLIIGGACWTFFFFFFKCQIHQ